MWKQRSILQSLVLHIHLLTVGCLQVQMTDTSCRHNYLKQFMLQELSGIRLPHILLWILYYPSKNVTKIKAYASFRYYWIIWVLQNNRLYWKWSIFIKVFFLPPSKSPLPPVPSPTLVLPLSSPTPSNFTIYSNLTWEDRITERKFTSQK